MKRWWLLNRTDWDTSDEKLWNRFIWQHYAWYTFVIMGLLGQMGIFVTVLLK